MDLYITEIETGTQLAFSMLPESVTCKAEAKFQTYDIINLGEVKIPKGASLTNFSWSGILPGKSRRDASFVKSWYWRDPKEIQSIWSIWRENGTKLKLMFTETTINHDVRLDNYTAEYKGGNGDIEYSISFTVAKDLIVYSMDELKSKTNSKTAARPPAAKAAAKTYTVKSGDSLWKIAQSRLGKGNRYTEIYNLNKDKIKNPSLIYSGQVLTLPS